MWYVLRVLTSNPISHDSTQNTLEDIHNLMLLDGTTTWDSVADESYLGRIVNTGIPSWSKALDESWDDAQVRDLAMMRLLTITDPLKVGYLGSLEDRRLQGCPRGGQQRLQGGYAEYIPLKSEFLRGV